MSFDYYAVLQVHSEADQEMIKAAYRYLMRKYHPDVQEKDQQDNPETIRKVQQINEAYTILSDPEKRAAYDAGRSTAQRHSYQPHGNQQPVAAPYGQIEHQIEKVYYPAACSKTRETFHIILARRAGSEELFRVVGFSPREVKAPSENKNPLDDGIEKTGKGLLNWFFGKEQPRIEPSFSGHDPDDEELLEMFDESRTLEFGDIDWAGKVCPVCESMFAKPDGKSSTWAFCSNCQHITCSGGFHVKNGKEVWYQCPTCKQARHITDTIKPGTKSRFHLKRDMARFDQVQPGTLPDGDKKHLASGED